MNSNSFHIAVPQCLFTNLITWSLIVTNKMLKIFTNLITWSLIVTNKMLKIGTGVMV